MHYYIWTRDNLILWWCSTYLSALVDSFCSDSTEDSWYPLLPELCLEWFVGGLEEFDVVASDCVRAFGGSRGASFFLAVALLGATGLCSSMLWALLITFSLTAAWDTIEDSVWDLTSGGGRGAARFFVLGGAWIPSGREVVRFGEAWDIEVDFCIDETIPLEELFEITLVLVWDFRWFWGKGETDRESSEWVGESPRALPVLPLLTLLSPTLYWKDKIQLNPILRLCFSVVILQ